MRRRSKLPQPELPVAGEVFNLAGERGEDPLRVAMDQGRQAAIRAEAEAYQKACQLLLEKCPGFLSADIPSSDLGLGKVVVEPGYALAAKQWLKRRFHVNESDLQLQDFGLCFQIRSRAKRRAHHSGRRVTFDKPKQFEFVL